MSGCPICGCPRQARFRALLLKKHDVQYFFCERCGLLQTEEPYWLNDAYASVIADADTGLVSRNLTIAHRLTNLLYWCFDPTALYLDFSGGYGLLTRLMRDRGFDYYWHDPYCKNVFARGFEWISAGQKASAVTAFEVLEHTADPLAFISKALAEANTSTIIFTTELYEGEPPRPEKWWYYALETGQHISFFRRDTLTVLGQKLGLDSYSNGFFHVLTSKVIIDARFRFCSSRLARALGPYVRMRMRSKTIEDHQAMARRSKQCT